ncbi:MAG TPA: hypothetical protein DCS93_07305 [Microscillaceae bacterium]|nr:hypothetical protein [Microscillaceae bacterium]
MKVLKEKFGSYKLEKPQLSEIKGGGDGAVEQCQRGCIGIRGMTSLRRCLDACKGPQTPADR